MIRSQLMQCPCSASSNPHRPWIICNCIFWRERCHLCVVGVGKVEHQGNRETEKNRVYVARRDRAKTHLETLRKIAREKRQAENARKRGVIPRFRTTPSETLRPLRSESTKKREDGSVTLLPFERGIGFPPELNTFERITPRQVETMQQDLDDLVATARKGSSRNSNPLNHMRQRMRTIERNSHKLPAL